MYGWEFPPFVSGGLGVACYNITKYLDPLVDKTYFVMPKNKVNESLFERTDLLGAAQQQPLKSIKSKIQKPSVIPKLQPDRQSVIKKNTLEHVQILPVACSLNPYDTQSEQTRVSKTSAFFETLLAASQVTHSSQSNLQEEGPSFCAGFDFSNPLFVEVMTYASQAACFAMMYEHDVIHAHDWLTIPAAFEAKKFSAKPVVLHVHATEYDRSGETMNTLIYEIERFGIQHADRVIAVSQYTKDILVARYGADADKVEVVHNGVAPKLSKLLLKKEQKKSTEKIVLYLGRLTFQKGPDYFIRAAKRILEHRRDLKFVIAGSGDMMPWLMQQVNEWGLGDHFYFTGFLNDDLVARLFRMSDVYILPSVSEPFGIAPLEALYYGVPVVLSKSSGVSEVLDHVLKVDFWDIDDMANKMMALLDYAPLRDFLMKGVSEELPGINWEVASQKIFNIYQRVTRS
eukprot:COSAG01_NODE_3_length_63519_cov_1591.007663_17_plen_457_part_00